MKSHGWKLLQVWLQFFTTVTTVISGNKMIMYRIQQLENKVAEYNNLKLRMLAVEKDIEVIKNENKVV